MPLISLPRVRQAQKAFTLIELLVVITIIALLAAILFPVFGRARENGRRSSCQSNLKQIGLGLVQYTQDYDATLPPKTLGITSELYTLPTLIFPYVKNEQVFVCASGETNSGQKTVAPGTRSYCGNVKGDGSDNTISKVGRLSYSRNLIPPRTSGAWMTGRSPSWNSTVATNPAKNGFIGSAGATLNEAAIEDAAGTIHLFDAWAGATGTVNCMTDGTLSNSMRGIEEEINTDRSPANETQKVANRHFEGFNALYGDGHVKWRRWGSTKGEEWTVQVD